MTLVRYRYDNPFNHFLNSYFNENMNEDNEKMIRPKANIEELEDKFLIQLAMPGVSKKDISMKVEDDELIIKAELKEEEKDYYLKEFEVANYERKFVLPETVNDDKIKASLENGILTIELPVKEEVHKKKEIAIA